MVQPPPPPPTPRFPYHDQPPPYFGPPAPQVPHYMAHGGERIAAYIVDWFLLTLIKVALFLILLLTVFRSELDAVMDGSKSEADSFEVFFWVFFGVLFALGIIIDGLYFVISEGRTGQTLGKRLLGIAVVSDELRQVGYGAATLRHLGRLLWNLSNIIVIIDIVLVFVSQRKRIGDYFGSTLVIRPDRLALPTMPLTYHQHAAGVPPAGFPSPLAAAEWGAPQDRQANSGVHGGGPPPSRPPPEAP